MVGMRPQSGSLLAEVARIAGTQHGVIGRSQLSHLGASPSVIKRWVASGHLHRLHRGVYAVGHVNLTQEGRWMAAVLACGGGAFLSHGPAGQLLGFLSRRERFALHVTLGANANRSPRGIVTHRPRRLDRADVTRCAGIPVTTATRTVWDLAAVLTPRGARETFHRAEKFHLLDRTRLAALLASSPSHKGAGVLRELLGGGAIPLDRTRTWLEDLLTLMCDEHGLPMPLVNAPLLDYEVDFLWSDARYVVEADGGDHLNREQRDKDNEQDATLQRAGYMVRRYGYTAMGRDSAVVAEVRGDLEARLGRALP
jgi:hypothetical protein